MGMSMRLMCLAVGVALLAACGKKDEAATAPPAPPQEAESTAASDSDTTRGRPDFGGIERVSRDVEAIGSTPELAILSALQSAVAQVNGVRVASQMQQVRGSLYVAASNGSSASMDAAAVAQQVIAASQGAIVGYEILSQEEINQVDEEIIARVHASDEGFSYSASASSKGSASASASAASGDASASAKMKQSYSEQANVEAKRGASSFSSDLQRRTMRSYWKVKVRAEIARYKAPDEQGRPKIVVALPHARQAAYAVGDGRVSSDEVAQAIRARLSDILTQTKRFIVLDREFGQDIQAEIDHINSGNVRLEDTARIGQQLATDLILIPTIERFEYPRSVRQLRMSDRQVSSYSGGGRITLRLINATTGEVVMSDSFDHQLASTGPSTLPRVVNGSGMASAMMDSLSAQIGTAIVTEIFPVSVISLQGDQVILSQGGDSLQEGQRWQAVQLGDALKDPQTGRSLGRSETPCCVIHIDRVASQTSYGTIEDAAGVASSTFKPGSIELRERLGAAKSQASRSGSGDGDNQGGQSAKPKAAKQSPAPAAAPAEDPNW